MNNCRIWNVVDGYFSSFNIIPSSNSELLTSTIRKLNIPNNTSIYLRGSYLEHDLLFPNSDIDLIVISDNIKQDFLESIRTCLVDFKRSVEILSLRQCEIQNRQTFRLLLHTRSLHISGQKIIFRPVKADLETMQDHFFQYKPHMMSTNLSLQKNIRIMQLKQITRSYGVLYFMHNSNVFSRDILTCLNWAIELDNKTGSVLKELWDSVDYPQIYKETDLNEIKSAFLIESKRALGKFKENEWLNPAHNSV